MKNLVFILALSLGLSVSPADALRKIEIIELAEGYDPEETILPGVVFDGASTPPLIVEALGESFDRKADFVRRIPGGFARPLRYGLASTVDIGDLMTRALKSESLAMGLRTAPADEAVKVRGTVSEIFFENRAISMGPILFYGYLHLDLELIFPDGRIETLNTVSHDMMTRYNAGFGARDEVSEAASRFFVLAAQEIISRIAREHLKAAPAPGIAALIPTLLHGGVDERYPLLRRIGLSGHPDALEPLLALLDREKEEHDRAQVISMLANLRRPEAIERLATRYKSDDDEDCRFQMIKAFVYRPDEKTKQRLFDLGFNDRDGATRRLVRYWWPKL